MASPASERAADLLLQALHAEVEKHEPVETEIVPLDASLREELEALGYIETESAPAPSPSSTGPDETL